MSLEECAGEIGQLFFELLVGEILKQDAFVVVVFFR